MDILLIGNGFDIAHGLKTKYSDFLRFSNFVRTPKLKPKSEFDKEITKYLNNLKVENITIYDELQKLINNNFWIDYFENKKNELGENWIDFESEISKVIQRLNEYSNDIDLNSDIPNMYVDIIENTYINECSLAGILGMPNILEFSTDDNVITPKMLFEILKNDLLRLIRSLGLYIADYINNISIGIRVPEIEKLSPQCILSFNYSQTYQRIYGKEKKIDYDYIHGIADMNHNIETNNMVLGIDEYLDKNKQNKDITFVYFKKYYQRILKETGCRYKTWLFNIDDFSGIKKNIRADQERSEAYKNHLFIFGHSLDVTDKDILNQLLTNDNIYTKIYYHDSRAHAQQIANLVKVIGPDIVVQFSRQKSKLFIMN